MDFSTAVTLESLCLTLGGVSILFSSEGVLALWFCWIAGVYLECIWRLSSFAYVLGTHVTFIVTFVAFITHNVTNCF